ncbi:metal ABC transporter substrate-binding protein [Caldibacillus lycopersici]|uniref:Metal ABC transporter substrate-binding protein n=1 Tax=Perspicuibacillus lycopersici TaxID=1325689 RepID=A0AAE3IR38_9BACI|nr:metal ABC transporter substrate-binding protein [Perspicuibacillus lycopersici]MCU9612892.1 metal ABC transporter substrate-binding protein [Perspicuibacillus lycopersici]
MKLKKLYMIGLLFVLLLLAACGNSGNSEGATSEEKLTIMTSIYPLYDFTSKIAGDRAEVINLVPAGAEPHDFEPTPKDMTTLSKSDLFIYNGSGFETWIDDVLSSVDQENMSVLNVTDNLDLLTLAETGGSIEHHHDHGEEATEEHDHDEHAEESDDDEHADETGEEHSHDEHEHAHAGEYDPHVWLDPMQAKNIAETIKVELVKVDPDGKEVYEQNYTALASELDQLDEEYSTVLSNAVQKDLIVSHAAFGYLTHRYNLNQISISGLSPSAEPSPQELLEIINFAKENNVQYILFETLVNPKVAQTVQEKVGAEALTLNPLEGLTKEDLDAGKDYFSVMRENLKTLKISTGSES